MNEEMSPLGHKIMETIDEESGEDICFHCQLEALEEARFVIYKRYTQQLIEAEIEKGR
jgi:hypothetical protein